MSQSQPPEHVFVQLWCGEGSDSPAKWNQRACHSYDFPCFIKCIIILFLSREYVYLVNDFFFFFKGKSLFRDSLRPPCRQSLSPVSGCASGTVFDMYLPVLRSALILHALLHPAFFTSRCVIEICPYRHIDLPLSFHLHSIRRRNMS